MKNIIATNLGQHEAVLGQIPHFGPLPFEKTAKGSPKKWKTKFHQIWFYSGSYPPNCWRGIFTLVPNTKRDTELAKKRH
jgi:hypothetical protein